MEELSVEEHKARWAGYLNNKYPPEAFVVFTGQYSSCSLLLKRFIPLQDRQNNTLDSFRRKHISEQTDGLVGGYRIYLGPHRTGRRIFFLTLPGGPKTAALRRLVNEGLIPPGDYLYEDSFGVLANDAPVAGADATEVAAENRLDGQPDTTTEVLTTMEVATENHIDEQSDTTEVATEIGYRQPSTYLDMEESPQHGSFPMGHPYPTVFPPWHATQIEPDPLDLGSPCPSSPWHSFTAPQSPLHGSWDVSLDQMTMSTDQCLPEGVLNVPANLALLHGPQKEDQPADEPLALHGAVNIEYINSARYFEEL